MKKHRSKVFKFNSDLDKAYRQLFGLSNPAGCTICGEDEPSVLDIHEADGSNDFKVLCAQCRGKIVTNDCLKTEKYNETQERITL